jgi:hypothetical protein
LKFFFVDHPRDGMADLLKVRKVPKVRKIAALLRFDRLNGAVISLEENTLTVRLLLQRQAGPVLPQAGKSLDELDLAESLERGEARDFTIRERYLARPSATSGATLALVKNRHGAGSEARSQNSEFRHVRSRKSKVQSFKFNIQVPRHYVRKKGSISNFKYIKFQISVL